MVKGTLSIVLEKVDIFIYIGEYSRVCEKVTAQYRKAETVIALNAKSAADNAKFCNCGLRG
jgi:hypothetical protein